MIPYSERKKIEGVSRSCIQYVCDSLKLPCRLLPDRKDDVDVIISGKRVELKFYLVPWLVHNWDHRALERRRIDFIFGNKNTVIMPADSKIKLIHVDFFTWNGVKSTLKKLFLTSRRHNIVMTQQWGRNCKDCGNQIIMKEYSAGKFRAYDPPDGERRHRCPMPKTMLDKQPETKRLDKWVNLQLFSDDEVQKIELPELRATIRKLNSEYLKEGEGTVGS